MSRTREAVLGGRGGGVWRDRNESKCCKVRCVEPCSLQSEGSSGVESKGALCGHWDKRGGLHNEVRRVKQHKRVATESK